MNDHKKICICYWKSRVYDYCDQIFLSLLSTCIYPHVSAAIRLSNEDKQPSKGDTIKYIYTDFQRKNPLRRVALIGSINATKEKLDYDKEKYKDMIIEEAETVLGYFGFDRTYTKIGKIC